MSEPRVDLLYDALHAFEKQRRRRRAYPVHKKLVAEPLDYVDIYDWIVERLQPRRVTHALDAGCGVGYGAIRLAQRLDCRVTGISVSEREVASARANVREARLERRVETLHGSFDALPVHAYDLVVAVESLKHSPRLDRSLRSLLASLRPGGELVIVDDFYDGRKRRVEAELKSDWELAHLYTEQQFIAALGRAAPHRIVDLTDGVRHGSRWGLALRSLALTLAQPFAGSERRRVLRAFRGGLRLEGLYAERAMAYKALFCSKAGET